MPIMEIKRGVKKAVVLGTGGAPTFSIILSFFLGSNQISSK